MNAINFGDIAILTFFIIKDIVLNCRQTDFKLFTLFQIKSRLEKNGFKLFRKYNLIFKSVCLQFSTMSLIMKIVNIAISPNLMAFILIT